MSKLDPMFGDTPMPELDLTEMRALDVITTGASSEGETPESPMEPVLKLWELGVCVEELTPEAIVLDRASRRYISYWSAGVPLTTSW
jgi:hypothetical protein